MRTIDWEIEYRRLAGRLLQVCRRYIKDRDVAEDVLQETFIVAMQKSASFTGKGAWDAWMYRLAVNMSLQYLRTQSQKQKRGLEIPLENLTISANLETIIEENQEDTLSNVSALTQRWAIAQVDFSQEQMLEAIHKLPEHHKMVFNLYVMDNFSHKEIAQALHISEGTSKSHLARARKRIQNNLYQMAQDMEKKEKTKKPLWALCLLLLGENYQLKATCKKAFSVEFPTPKPGLQLQSRMQSSASFTSVKSSVPSWLVVGCISVGSAAVGATTTYCGIKMMDNGSQTKIEAGVVSQEPCVPPASREGIYEQNICQEASTEASTEANRGASQVNEEVRAKGALPGKARKKQEQASQKEEIKLKVSALTVTPVVVKKTVVDTVFVE